MVSCLQRGQVIIVRCLLLPENSVFSQASSSSVVNNSLRQFSQITCKQDRTRGFLYFSLILKRTVSCINKHRKLIVTYMHCGQWLPCSATSSSRARPSKDERSPKSPRSSSPSPSPKLCNALKSSSVSVPDILVSCKNSRKVSLNCLKICYAH